MRFALLILVFLTGSVELVYEVLWMRRFAIILGSTAPAAAVTLSAIFLGMAAGSLILGRTISGRRGVLRAYALLQVGTAVGAALFEPALRLSEALNPWMLSSLAQGSLAHFAGSALISSAAVVIPSFFMGGLFPLVGQLASGEGSGRAPAVEILYATSLLGACGGTLLVPLFLLPHAGVNGSYALAIGANLVLAALAMTASLSLTASASVSEPTNRRGPPTAPALDPPPTPGPRLPSSAGAGRRRSRGDAPHLALAFFSGALMMGLEVLWARMFSMVHENSIYSFAGVLSLFLLGLVGGAVVARGLAALRVAPALAAGLSWGLAGVLVVSSPRLFHSLTAQMAYAPGGASWGLLPARAVSIAAVVLLPAVILCGVLFPLLLSDARARSSPDLAGRRIGTLLAANTTGAILGPILFAFVVGPALGLWWSLAGLGLAFVAAGMVSSVVLRGARMDTRPTRISRVAPAMTGAVGVAALMVLWLSHPGDVPRARFDAERGESLLAIIEGPRGTLAVLEDGRSRWVTFNNHYTLGGTASTGDERQQGHIPILLHPAPHRVAFIGLGTGITAGAALLHPIDFLTVIEILPEAVTAARDYFAEANVHLMDDPRTEVVVGDARSYFHSTPRRFDVIVGDLVTPWRPGEALLYSREHFETIRYSLEPGGLFCQWLPLFQLTEEGFAILAATFLDVFPGATLWRGDLLPDQPALALIGSLDSRPLDPAQVDERVRRLAPRLVDRVNPYLADPSGLWLYLMGPLDAREPWIAAARRNEDAHPWIELLSPFTQVGGDGAHSGPFVGRRLEASLEALQRRSLEGTWLEKLTPEHQRWREAGAALWHASLLAREKRTEEASRLGLHTLSTLPEKLQMAVAGRVIRD